MTKKNIVLLADGHHGETIEYYTEDEGLRNIANGPEYINRERKAMYEYAVEAKKRRYRDAIFLIKRQPFYT